MVESDFELQSSHGQLSVTFKFHVETTLEAFKP